MATYLHNSISGQPLLNFHTNTCQAKQRQLCIRRNLQLRSAARTPKGVKSCANRTSIPKPGLISSYFHYANVLELASGGTLKGPRNLMDT
ncbi:hypothetical protein CEXT_149791 [Caerostris extrusa]|uniref:Uncharacterized protein n=1 Tax=Caerostris extrusa TaxID=172846 RepID=A0AAV4QSW4_CAEEX|nr:hypothetical protein CEXT_149791 [Caerostris extrusa]